MHNSSHLLCFDKRFNALSKESIRQNDVYYLQTEEIPEILLESSLIIFTKSRPNLNPEKLHSEGKANKLYTSPALHKQI